MSTPERRDVYANLLRDTRGLRREQAHSRDGWYDALPWATKEETLFELEMLLKGFACFGNARNHPGRPHAETPIGHDFREELRIVRDALQQAVARVRELLGERDRAYVFSRYLETLLPADALRSQLVQEQLSQDTPDESLFVLRNTFGAFLEMAEGMLRLGRVPHRLYFALLGSITREVARNTYFNPLVALEFRPELDRIRNAEVLEALHEAHDAAHRVVALTFLTLFRALRYLDLIDEYASAGDAARRSYLILSVLRSDLRALTRFLGSGAGDDVADAFERQLLRVPAGTLVESKTSFMAQADRLISLRSTLEGLANMLRVEVRQVFERELPALSEEPEGADLGERLVLATATLRATAHHAVRTLTQELRPGLVPPALAGPGDEQRVASERLRRDIWMFAQILRAFLAKAKATRGDADRWSATGSFHFVQEFLGHFRAIGYQLVRSSDYERLDHFLHALDALRDVDLLEAPRLRAAIAECEAFRGFLEQLFREVGQRRELQTSPFDRQAAADTLRIYLGAA
ncbi:MAG: hypothetical protein AAGH15_08760 [Myxococcota bacterium]